MEHEHSFVVVEEDRVVAMTFVMVVEGVHYVDPIVVASDRNRRGVSRDATRILLDSLVSEGVSSVGEAITDGNVASGRLFLGLGFARRGSSGLTEPVRMCVVRGSGPSSMLPDPEQG